MDFKQNPFSIYDFLGYLIPGAICAYAGIAFAAAIDPIATPASIISERLDFARAELYIPFILFAYILGHSLSFVSSVTVERYSIWQFGYPSKGLLGFTVRSYYEVEPPRWTRRVVRFLIGAFLLPVTAFDVVIGRPLHVRELYVRPLDPFLAKLVTKKLVDLMVDQAKMKEPDELDAKKHDFFRYAYHFALEHAPAHRPKMQNYVALYGFLRSLCLIAVLAFWADVGAAVLGEIAWRKAGTLASVCGLLAIISFMAFMKFYRRFTLEVYMAVTVLKCEAGGPVR